MIRALLTAALLAALSLPAVAGMTPFPASFHTRDIAVKGAKIHVRVGGKGPAVVLLHGFGDTGDMWAPLAADLAKDHRVVVPDLRGMGLSSLAKDGYDKKTQAGDVRAVLASLGIEHSVVIGHDIGTMVAFAYAARYPQQTDALVVMDAPVPGVPPWNDIVRSPMLWHFDFGGPDMERLVAGRERIYLDRFWNEFAGDPKKVDEATRQHYAKLYARPGYMHAAFSQFHAIRQDGVDNEAAIKTKLSMPVLAVGGEKSFGANEAIVMRNAADKVTEVVVPGAGHWLMEEAPGPTIKVIRDFLPK